MTRIEKENEGLKENQCCPETCEYIATEIIRYANVCRVNSKYKQALEEIRENILSRYSIDKNKEIIARPLEDLWCIEKLINEVLNDRD